VRLLLRAGAALVMFIAFGGLLGAAWQGVLQTFAIVSLAAAYVGGALAILIGSVVWVFVLLLPSSLYYSSLVNYPGLWRKPNIGLPMKVGMTVGLLFVFGGLAELIGEGVAYGISWIADHDCRRALTAGVTGSRPC
jgi:hypothetical protein